MMMFAPSIPFWMSLVVVQPAIAMAAAFTFARFLLCMAAVTVLACKVFHQTCTRNAHDHDDNDAASSSTTTGNEIYSNLFAFEDHGEETNLVPFAPFSISVVISLSFSVDEGINLVAPSMELSSNGSSNEETKKKNGPFIGPSFVQYREPSQTTCDNDDEDDESSIFSGVSGESFQPRINYLSMTSTLPTAIFVETNDDVSSIGFADTTSSESSFQEQPRSMTPNNAVPDVIFIETKEMMSEEEKEQQKIFLISRDYFDYREPQNDFDDDKEESTADSTDEVDASMEDLLFSFSKMSLTKDNKTISDSEMEDLVNSFANF